MSSGGFEKPIAFRKEDDENNDGSHDTHNFHEKNSYDLNSKIMLTAIISLSVVVVLVLALHIYARYVLRRQARRRRAAIHHLGITVAQVRSADHQQPPKTGLDSSVIDSLPIFAFQSTSSSMAECAVCLSALDDGEMVRLLPNCKHIFHVECIDKWLSSQSTCPICRTEVEPRRIVLESEPREGPVESITSPSAPPEERLNSVSSCMELATSSGHDSGKVVVNNTSGGNNSTRLSSFRRILSRERSSRRIQPCGQQDDQDVIEDLERQ